MKVININILGYSIVRGQADRFLEEIPPFNFLNWNSSIGPKYNMLIPLPANVAADEIAICVEYAPPYSITFVEAVTHIGFGIEEQKITNTPFSNEHQQ